MARQINYSKRDFASLKTEQINFIKQYYPGLIQNFNDASILSVFLDLNAAIADNLHFHIDRALQETVLDFAQERSSLFNIAKTYGLKIPNRAASVAVCQFTVDVPVKGDAEDIEYLPILYAGSQFFGGDEVFELLYDIDFSSNFNISGRVDRTKVPIFVNGVIRSYRITKTGIVIGGATRVFTQKISNTRPFYQITLPEDNVLSIESIIHKPGTTFQTLPTNSQFNSDINKWYEVPSLAEDSIFTNDGLTQPTNGVFRGEYKKVDRRYVKEFTPNGFCNITFGSLTDQGFDILDDFVDAGTFNLNSFLNNISLGLAPINNTTMYIKYRIGGGESTNVQVGAINTIGSLSIQINGSDQEINSIVESSITVNNVTPAIGGGDAPSIEEIRNYISFNFAAQNRAVTLQDYKAILLNMPTKFGAPSKISVSQVQNKINVGVLTKDSSGNLSDAVSSVILENVANYLSKYRMVNDFVVVKPASVINIAFEISVLTEPGSQVNVIANIASTLTDEFSTSNVDLGKSYLMGNLTKKLSQIDGVLNINYIKVFNRFGGEYSNTRVSDDLIFNLFTNEIDVTDGLIRVNSDQILELRIPERDIEIIPTTQVNIFNT